MTLILCTGAVDIHLGLCNLRIIIIVVVVVVVVKNNLFVIINVRINLFITAVIPSRATHDVTFLIDVICHGKHRPPFSHV